MLKDLIELFMKAWMWKIRTAPTRNTSPGKRYLGWRRDYAHQWQRPAGSKLMKRFHRLEWMAKYRSSN